MIWRQLRAARQARRPRVRALFWTVFGLAAAGLALGFVVFVQSIEEIETRPTRHAQAAVVLTGGADRIADAIDLLAAGHTERLLITGVNPSTSREGLARSLPRVGGLIHCCVELGYQALNTAGNARETADWVKANNIRSLIVVTSNYHMPRALAEIGELLPHTELQPYAVVSEQARSTAWWADAQRTRLITWEYLKYVAVLTRQTLAPRLAEDAPTVVARGRG
jgi:uncharacterized SAM-binding protein YcdF (DUF218 family)